MAIQLISDQINNTRMGFLSFFCPKNVIQRKRIENNLNPSFSVRHMILALDKLPPGRAYLNPHTDKTSLLNIFEKRNRVNIS